MKGDLILVHCVDTEGPLNESVTATFERIETVFGLKYEPSPEQLSRLQQGHDIPDDLRDDVMTFISPNRLNYHKTWTEVDKCVRDLMRPEWRMALEDDYGQGYTFSWFILDHVGFEINPRQRVMGFHGIYEHYRELLAEFKPPADKLYYHTHPVPFFFEANKTSNNFSFTNHHIQVINRRVIDYLDFPTAYRPGANCERPDMNLFLEMWIPFDFGNQGMKQRAEERIQKDLAGGRWGDWRRATPEWEVYHPDFYDYQKKGNMRRYIARSLNLNSRVRPISHEEVEKAFVRANSGKHTIMAVTDHDEREMRPYIIEHVKMVRELQKNYPDVKIRYANAADAIRMAEGIPHEEPTELTFNWDGDALEIFASKEIWGPQPWFCFKTKDQRYIHENLDRLEDEGWGFVFDDNTIFLEQIESIGIATNDRYGNTSIYRLSPDKDLGKTASMIRNRPVLDTLQS